MVPFLSLGYLSYPIFWFLRIFWCSFLGEFSVFMIAILCHITIHKTYLLGTNYDLQSGQIQLWELDCKESKVPKNLCLQTVVLENILESALDSKEIKPVNPKGNQPWIFIGRTGAEAEAPVFWSPDGNSRLIGKVPDTGKDWGQREKRVYQRMRWLDGITDLVDMNLGKFIWEMMRDKEAWHTVIYGVTKSWTQLGDWKQ